MVRGSARVRLRGMGRISVRAKLRGMGKDSIEASLRGMGRGSAEVRSWGMDRNFAEARMRCMGRSNDAKTALRVIKETIFMGRGRCMGKGSAGGQIGGAWVVAVQEQVLKA